MKSFIEEKLREFEVFGPMDEQIVSLEQGTAFKENARGKFRIHSL